MNLIFRPLELVILGLATAIFAYISLDGESNWLQGVQLAGAVCDGWHRVLLPADDRLARGMLGAERPFQTTGSRDC